MAFKLIDFDGGELPLGFICEPEDVQFLVLAVADRLAKIDYGPYCFGLQFRSVDFGYRRDILDAQLRRLSNLFHPIVGLYEVDKLVIFDLRGPTGGVKTAWIAYIIQKERKENDQKRND